MKHTVLYNNGIHYLIERRYDTGEVNEYVCCSFYNPETDSWSWGHYFQSLLDAADFFRREWNGENKVWVITSESDGDNVEVSVYRRYEDAKKAFDEKVEDISGFYDESETDEFNVMSDFASFRDDTIDSWNVLNLSEKEVV